MQNLPSTNLLAMIANANARGKLRQDEALYAELCELSFNQRDVENCAPRQPLSLALTPLCPIHQSSRLASPAQTSRSWRSS